MTVLVEPLAWDSAFFGMPVGRADLGDAAPQRLRDIDAEAAALGIACLYGRLDPGVDPHAAERAQAAGHRLVEVAITFDRGPVPYEARPSRSTVRRGGLDDLSLLDEAVATLAPWSRFGADPRFGADVARRLFHAWVERAAHDDDRMLSIAEDETGVTGIAAHVREAPPRIDLLGVTKPGSGASWALMSLFIEWAGEGPVVAGPSAARNIPVIRFLEHGGFRSSLVHYVFHRWYDETEAGP